MQFVLHELAGLEEVAKLPGFEDTTDVADAILEEAATFASEVLDPINHSGDKEGCTWSDGDVTTPKGFKEAYHQFAKAGWIGLPVPAEYGGQGLPSLMLGPTLEMWNASNIGFANGPLLNQGAIEAIELIGSDEQKKLYIPKLVDGTWTGTMCLTEPQAGSDLAQVRTKAVPEGDRYRITGQKIFITFGEHDMADNIVHLVLARLPDAPEGTKGISMFIVPKFIPNADGSLGERNDIVCAGIEHKMGINGNPTCTMNLGEKQGAIGYLVGRPNEGLKYMFVMMNAARFSVGVQGLALADRAYQAALQYAKERVQFRDVASRSPEPKRIIEHPDVRRMLMTMKSQIEAMRALSYVTAASLDFSHKHPDEKVRKEQKAFVELMIPVVKGWCTETAVEICSTALQVFGGIGYVEETGIAQQLPRRSYHDDLRRYDRHSSPGLGRAQARAGHGRDCNPHHRNDAEGRQGVGRGRKRGRFERLRRISQRHRPGAGKRHQCARRDLAVDRDDGDGRPAKSGRVQRAVFEAVGHYRGRLANGARRTASGGEDRRGRCRERVL